MGLPLDDPSRHFGTVNCRIAESSFDQDCGSDWPARPQLGPPLTTPGSVILTVPPMPEVMWKLPAEDQVAAGRE
jgi:hypothetical protein